MSSNEYPKFSDFATEDKPLEGEKRKLDDILNKYILNNDLIRTIMNDASENLSIYNPLLKISS
jgi:hypothetical protein